MQPAKGQAGAVAIKAKEWTDAEGDAQSEIARRAQPEAVPQARLPRPVVDRQGNAAAGQTSRRRRCSESRVIRTSPRAVGRTARGRGCSSHRPDCENGARSTERSCALPTKRVPGRRRTCPNSAPPRMPKCRSGSAAPLLPLCRIGWRSATHRHAKGRQGQSRTLTLPVVGELPTAMGGQRRQLVGTVSYRAKSALVYIKRPFAALSERRSTAIGFAIRNTPQDASCFGPPAQIATRMPRWRADPTPGRDRTGTGGLGGGQAPAAPVCQCGTGITP
jgi:hypothetical protein